MKRLEHSSTPLVRRNMVSSPMGLLVRDGLKHAFTIRTNCGQVSHPPLSSILWNHS
jgi:hypothetical protein